MYVPLAPVPETRLALFAPPYERFEPVSTDWTADVLPPRGLAMVWWLVDGQEQQNDFAWLHRRPFGLPLFVVLPPASELARAMPLLAYVNALGPRGVLPTASVITPYYFRQLLAAPPRDLARAVSMYLAQRGLLTTAEIRNEIEQVFRHVPAASSISVLARRMYTSRRTLGRHFAAAGLPVPSHWLQFARLLYAIVHLHAERSTVFRIAARAGYPDGFTMSNQMKRMIGHRPTEVRSLLGWEWVVECWIRHEVETGGIDRNRFPDAVSTYLPGSFSTHS